MLIVPVCFRWLVALLAVLAFAVPVAMPSTVAAAEPVRSVTSAPTEGSDNLAVALETESAADVAESSVETFFGDYPHEADKLLLMSALQWASTTAVWGGFYAGILPPHPVFSFDRPPKLFVA